MVAGVVAVAAAIPSVIVAAVLILTVAVLVVVASVGPDQWGVAHAADDVFHAGAFGTEVLVRQPVQVKGGEGEGLRGSMGVEARRWRWPPEGGGGRWRGKRRPRREAVRWAVLVTGGVTAGVLSLDL